MKRHLLHIFLFLTQILFGQNTDYTTIPTKNEFLKLAAKYKVDTLKIGDYNILIIKRTKKYNGYGYQKNISPSIKETLYLVNDSLTFKSYTFKTDLNLKKPTKDYFLFPDSTLGLLIYEYISPFNEGSCGACIDIEVKAKRIDRQNNTSTITKLWISETTNQISIDKKIIFGYYKAKEYLKYSNKWDEAVGLPNVIDLIFDNNIMAIKMKSLDINNLIQFQTNATLTFVADNGNYKGKLSNLRIIK